MPVPSLAPLPGAVALPEPSRNGVPVEFGLPRLTTDWPVPLRGGFAGHGPRPPLPPRAPAARAEVPASKAVAMSEDRRMNLVFIPEVQPRCGRTVTAAPEMLWPRRTDVT